MIDEAVEMISDCGRTFAGGSLIVGLAINKVKFDYRCGFFKYQAIKKDSLCLFKAFVHLIFEFLLRPFAAVQLRI